MQLKETVTGQRILQLSGEEQCELVIRLIAWLDHNLETEQRRAAVATHTLIELLRRKIPFRHGQLVELIQWFQSHSYLHWHALSTLVTQIKHYTGHSPMTPDLRDTIARLVQTLKSGSTASRYAHWRV